MDLMYLRKLIKLLERSNVSEIEVEEEGLRVRVAKASHNSSPASFHPSAPAVADVPPAAEGAPATPAQVPSTPAPVAAEAKYHEIKSPIVGTFYRAPSPDAPPYVEVGQLVQPKTVLCIIEAMKLMNEIESDVGGRIIKIHVENGQPVEYNQVLFHVEPL